MLESVAKAMWVLLTGAFVFGAWSATLEVRSQSQEAKIEAHDAKITSFENEYKDNQRFLIDILGRMDERLKNIEKK